MGEEMITFHSSQIPNGSLLLNGREFTIHNHSIQVREEDADALMGAGYCMSHEDFKRTYVSPCFGTKITMFVRPHSNSCMCSFCINNRNIAKALMELGYDVKPVRSTFGHTEYPTAVYGFATMLIIDGKQYTLMYQENDPAPIEMVKWIEKYSDYLWAGSKFVKDIVMHAGLAEEKIIYQHIGYDTELYNYKNE